MKSNGTFRQLTRFVLTLSAGVFFFAVAFPHVHTATTGHREESCRACKIQESFSAAAPAAVALPVPLAFNVVATIDLIEASSLDSVDSLHAPRSPPAIS